MISTEGRLANYPFALLSELRDAANEHGYRIGPEEAGGWIFFRSASAPGEIALAAASANGPFFVSISLQGVAQALHYNAAGPSAKGHAGAFMFATRDALRTGVQATYQLSVSLPDFPLEKYERAVSGLGETEGARVQKFRIGQDIFREALIEFWNGTCPLSGISTPCLLRASHLRPWSHCETDSQRLDVHNGLLLSPLWDAAVDAGLVTFDDSGRVLPSDRLEDAARDALNINTAPIIKLSERHLRYLSYHRSHVWVRV